MHVKGHSGDKGNNGADKLAVAGSSKHIRQPQEGISTSNTITAEDISSGEDEVPNARKGGKGKKTKGEKIEGKEEGEIKKAKKKRKTSE